MVTGLSLQATSAEAEIRLGEVKKEAYEFERDVTRGGVNPVSNHNYHIITAPTVLCYTDRELVRLWQRE